MKVRGRILITVGTLVGLVALFLVSMPTAFMRSTMLDSEHKVNLPLVMNAPSFDTAAANKVMSYEVASLDQAGLDGFWTQEARDNAIPMDIIQASPEQASAANTALNAEMMIAGEPAFAPSSAGDESLTALAKQMYADQWVESAPVEDSAALAGYSYPPPFTRYLINAYSQSWGQYPFRAVGKLYFTIPNTSGLYSCSASVLGGRSIWTAGHCVHTLGKGWHTRMAFYPAYRDGYAPYGSFGVFYMASLSGWISSENLAYDIAIASVVDKNGYKLNQWVGNLGSAWNLSSTRHFHALGYPGNLYGGSYLIACAASTSVLDTNFSPNTTGIGCDMGGGSSGGPWVINYQPYAAGSINYVNGVTSYGYNGRPYELFAAYFGSGAQALYTVAIAK